MSRKIAFVFMIITSPLFGQTYISPNNDGIKDELRVRFSIEDRGYIVAWRLLIANEAGETVRVIENAYKRPAISNLKGFWAALRRPKQGLAVPEFVLWDGKDANGEICPDARYTYWIEATDDNGNTSASPSYEVLIDIRAPEITVQAPWSLFSPDNDTYRDTIPFAITSTNERLWTGRIVDASGTAVREYTWENSAVPSFQWDGTDKAGNKVPDGIYSLELAAEDEAGNKGSAVLHNITVDARPANTWVLAAHKAIAPLGRTKTQSFALKVALKEGLESWTFNVRDGKTDVLMLNGDGKSLPETVTWDGRTEDGTIAEGSAWTGVLTLNYTKGNKVRAESSFFVCTGLPPQLDVNTLPEYFSPDDDGVNDTLSISLSAKSLLPLNSWSFVIFEPNNRKPFWTASGKSKPPEQLTWSGRGNNGVSVEAAMDYPYTFTVTDVEGQSTSLSGEILVDVLVLRDGDLLRLRIPAIRFRADHADFGSKAEYAKGLEPEVIANNNRILQRVAQILNKFKDYTVTIEGHANNVSGTELEETQTTKAYGPALVQLSLDRAEFVKAQLVQLGVNGERLSTVGIGGRRPVASHNDRDNWWKNRRVEFILDRA